MHAIDSVDNRGQKNCNAMMSLSIVRFLETVADMAIQVASSGYARRALVPIVVSSHGGGRYS